MPNCHIVITDTNEPGEPPHVKFRAATSDGHVAECVHNVTYTESPLMKASIINEAKACLAAQGVVFVGGDKFIVFGWPS